MTERIVSYGRGSLAVPAGTVVYPCVRCRREFVSDRSLMAEAGFCMLCRPSITVSCRFCEQRCPGRYDGDECCALHRAMPAEMLQRLYPHAPSAIGR